MRTKDCGNCSRRKFYQIGYRDGFNSGYEYGCEIESDIMVEDYLRLRKIKNKIEEFIFFYDMSPGIDEINGQQLIDNLKEHLKNV